LEKIKHKERLKLIVKKANELKNTQN